MVNQIIKPRIMVVTIREVSGAKEDLMVEEDIEAKISTVLDTETIEAEILVTEVVHFALEIIRTRKLAAYGGLCSPTAAFARPSGMKLT